MSERYVSWLITCLFITEFRFDAIWVLSWMTKILIHGSCLHGLHFFPGRRFPTPAIWRSVIVSRHVTGEKGAVLPLKCDCKYWTNELKLSRPRKAYSFHQADSWYFANILVLELTFEYCALLMSVVLTRSNSLPPCVFHIGLRCCTIALLGHNVRSWNTLNTFLWDSGKNKVLANITYMAKFGSCLGRHLTSLRPWYHADLLRNHRLHCRGVTREERGHNSPRAESLWGRRITAWGAESPNNITSDFFSAVHLLPKDLRLEHGGAESLRGAPKVPTISQVISSVPYICFRKTSGSNTNPVSTGWIVLVCSIKYVVTMTKKFPYSSSDRQPDNISEGGNTVLHENVYIRTIYPQ